jgi:hypothetical protein
MSAIPPDVRAQIDRSFSILTTLIDATASVPPARGEIIKQLIAQLLEQLGPAILTWIIALLTPPTDQTHE